MILLAKKARNREWNGVEGWGFGDTGVVVLSPLRVKERRKEISVGAIILHCQKVLLSDQESTLNKLGVGYQGCIIS